MAHLPTNYRDDILNTTVNPNRVYQMETVGENKVSLEDVSVYTQNGNSHTAGVVNRQNEQINQNTDDIAGLTENLTFNNPTAGVVGFPFKVDVTDDGEWGYHKIVEGADTVVPFKSGANADDVQVLIASDSGGSVTVTEPGLYLASGSRAYGTEGGMWRLNKGTTYISCSGDDITKISDTSGSCHAYCLMLKTGNATCTISISGSGSESGKGMLQGAQLWYIPA